MQKYGCKPCLYFDEISINYPLLPKNYAIDLFIIYTRGLLTEPFTLFGIRFAPLWLPLERRLQTAAVLFWILLFTVSPSLTMFILYYTIAKTTYFKWVGILYTAWYIYDFDTCNKGGRR